MAIFVFYDYSEFGQESAEKDFTGKEMGYDTQPVGSFDMAGVVVNEQDLVSRHTEKFEGG